MKSTLTVTYPAQPDAVAAMLADPAYQRSRLDALTARLGQDSSSVTIMVDGDASSAFTVTTSGVVSAQQLPAQVRRFLTSGLTAQVTESWHAPDEEARRTSSVAISVAGAPVKASAHGVLAANGHDSSTLTLDVDLTVSVPLLGRTIESKAMGMIERATAAEERHAAAWLASH